MAKSSGVYKKDGFLFRYDFERSVVEYICKASAEDLEDNKRWQEEYKRDLWDIDKDGYMVLDSAGLSVENWKDKECRDEYLAEWIFELQAESSRLAKEFIKEEKKQ